MTDPQRSLSERFQQGLAELRTRRDELKLKLHLAGMDARETWRTLEPRLEELERQATEFTESTASATVEAATKVARDLASSFDDLRKKLQGGDSAGSEASEAADADASKDSEAS